MATLRSVQPEGKSRVELSVQHPVATAAAVTAMASLRMYLWMHSLVYPQPDRWLLGAIIKAHGVRRV